MKSPIPTLRRYPLYYQFLLSVIKDGEETISSEELGQATGSAPEQVRKDLGYLEGQGRSHIGYSTRQLADAIVVRLGMVQEKPAVLVGVGNLGRAISLYPGFNQYGLRITHLFDINPNIIGSRVGDIEVMAADQMPCVVKVMKIRVGIITTPPSGAREIAKAMTENGIRAIWNFSTAHLHGPEGVMVRNVDLSTELAVISHFIAGLEKSTGSFS